MMGTPGPRQQMSPSTQHRLSELVRLDTTRPLVALRAASFYAAIGLPIVYLPMVAGGVAAGDVPALAALFAANAVALVLGHGYGDD